jgi:hypothetical protein
MPASLGNRPWAGWFFCFSWRASNEHACTRLSMLHPYLLSASTEFGKW